MFLSPRRKPEAESVPVDTVRSRLFASVDARVRLHPGLSGVVELRDARDAFAARAHLADAAEYTLDIQYYIWRNDMSGTMLFEAIRRAADRGVRVRLLLDDNNTNGQDEMLGALDSHPNIEVRLFNPFLMRRIRTLNIYDFSRLNRRMHNKSFTADNLVTIVGGRNVGDEYFDAHNEIAFVDLDVMAIGPVVDEVSKDFERYWRSPSAYPLKSILRRPPRATVEAITKAAQAVTQHPRALTYARALQSSRFVQDLIAGTLNYHWASVRILSDDPEKVLGRARSHEMLSERLLAALGQPKRELHLVSAYFVPTRAGTQMLLDLARNGVKVTVLTNALEATDVAVVHAGYAKRRKALLKAGIEIYELKRMSELTSGRDRKLTGNSGSSLHAKTFVVDRERLFVGSFNFDPRSAQLNTELGFLIESPAMAAEIAKTFDSEIPATSYQVRLARHGLLQWVERRGRQEIVHKREPGATPLKRLMLYVLSKLPIEWLL
ncbi:MAG TPA: phospholipase D family protein [Steroidobacteraceae bacterium]